MKKIDQYILRKYLVTFFFCLLLFTAIIVVIDISEHTDNFVNSGLSAWQIFTDFYLGLIPRLDAMLFPLFTFISVIFFTSKMASRSEVIAILSSGVSFRRYVLPFMVGSFILAGMLWYGYQFVVPKANRKWADFNIKYIDNTKRPDPNSKRSSYKTNIYFKLDSFSYVGIKSYDTVSKMGNNLFIQKFDGNKLKYNLRAGTFAWDTARNKWKLNYVQERYLDSISERVVASDEKLMGYNFKPIDLRNDDYLKDQMTTKELNRFISTEQQRGSEDINSLLVERYNRDAIPVSVVILTLIGVSLASRRVRGGSGAHLALGVLISVGYILFGRISSVFATQGSFHPLLASWTPNIIFGLLAFYLYKRAPK